MAQRLRGARHGTKYSGNYVYITIIINKKVKRIAF
jgi:hypothetical protein